MYHVTIKYITEIKKPTQEYKKIADSGNEKDGGAVYDYVNTTETVDEETTVLKQILAEINLASVIKALNDL